MAVMGEALQFKFNVALLKLTALDPKPVPLADARTLTGSKRRMEFWATIAGTTKAEHAAIALQRRMDTFLIFRQLPDSSRLKGDGSETPDTIGVW
jgi:hypothetical protein